MDEESFHQDLAKLCAEAFGDDTEAAVLFMIRPHPELHYRTPGSIAVTEAGARAVAEVIQRGLYGLPI